MNKAKLKKYVGKRVKVHFRYRMRTSEGIVIYKPNEPLTNYLLYQPQNSGHGTFYYVALTAKMIGHIELLQDKESE